MITSSHRRSRGRACVAPVSRTGETTGNPWPALRLQPGAENDPAEIPVGVLAYLVQRAGADPQDHPSEVVRVPVDQGVEEADGCLLGPQELFGVVEVSPGLRDGPAGIVVEALILVTGDDVP